MLVGFQFGAEADYSAASPLLTVTQPLAGVSVEFRALSAVTDNGSSWGQASLSPHLLLHTSRKPHSTSLWLFSRLVVQAYCVIQAAGWVTSVPHYSS